MHEPLHGEAADPDAERAPGDTQQEGLGEHLANDARPRGAQRRANCDFAHAAWYASEQQAGQVGAYDQQHSANRCKKKHQPAASWPDDLFFEGQEHALQINAFICLLGDLRLNYIELSDSLLLAHTGFESRDSGEIEFANEALLVVFRAIQRFEESDMRVTVSTAQGRGETKRRR